LPVQGRNQHPPCTQRFDFSFKNTYIVTQVHILKSEGQLFDWMNWSDHQKPTENIRPVLNLKPGVEGGDMCVSRETPVAASEV
jgi:hypothetical protein